LIARQNGFSGDQIICNGIGRPTEFLKRAYLDKAYIIIDSLGDFQKAIQLLEKYDEEINLGIRVKLDLSKFPTSPYSRDSVKLGIIPSSNTFNHILTNCHSNSLINLDMLHVHTTINETSSDIYKYALLQLRDLILNIEGNFPHLKITKINIGGGFGMKEESFKDNSESIFKQISDYFLDIFGKEFTLIIEPGRYLVNKSGYVFTRVTDIKENINGSFFIFVDASTNVLIPIPSASYCLLYPQNTKSKGYFSVAIVDGITSPDNIIISRTYLDNLPNIGDLLILGNCGAYTDVLSEFWAFNPFLVSFLNSQDELIFQNSRIHIDEARKLLIGI
jgi:diaminopimelate decarboxylase